MTEAHRSADPGAGFALFRQHALKIGDFWKGPNGWSSQGLMCRCRSYIIGGRDWHWHTLSGECHTLESCPT